MEDKAPELEKISLKNRVEVFKTLYPKKYSYLYKKEKLSKESLEKELINAHIPTHKIKVNA
jgi:hypothetical protein